MTLAAEIGGVALVLQLLVRPPVPRADRRSPSSGSASCIWVLPFEWIERLFGYGGLCLLVFVVAAIKLHPDWGSVGHGFVPHADTRRPPALRLLRGRPARRGDDAVRGLLLLLGAVEEGWTPKDLGLNRANSIDRLRPRRGALVRADDHRRRALPPAGDRAPSSLGTVALGADSPRSAQIGLLLALVGILFAVGGAAIDTCFSGAYNLAQFFGWEWGKYRRPADAPRFTLSWIVAARARVR